MRAVQVGTPAGDFGVITLDNGRGWVVTGHHPDIPTFVPREELEEDAGELLVGMHGALPAGEDAGGFGGDPCRGPAITLPAPPSSEKKKPGICRALSSCLVA